MTRDDINPRVYLTYHGDGNVGIGTPPQGGASAPMGGPVEHLRVSMTDGATWNKAIAHEREACAKVVEDYCGAWDDKGYALANAIRARGQQ